MMRPWKLLRFLLCVVLWAVLAWLGLAILWASLPFPLREHEGDNGSDYATFVLRSGKWLTRVYSPSSQFSVHTESFESFALDYRLHTEDLSVEIAGYEQRIPIITSEGEISTNERFSEVSHSMLNLNVTVRVANSDGANLPWFPVADGMLLYWCIQKDNLGIPLVARWSKQDGLTTLTLKSKKHSPQHLLEVGIHGRDPTTIVATVPTFPVSGSPSKTYPIRVALIFLIAPTAVFVNDHFGFIIRAFSNTFVILFTIFIYGFLTLAVIVSLWRCLRGPSLEGLIISMQERMERLHRHESLRVLRLDTFIDTLDGFRNGVNYGDDTWVQWFVQICKDGWHPERTRALKEAAKTDLENNIAAAKLIGEREIVSNASSTMVEEEKDMDRSK